MSPPPEHFFEAVLALAREAADAGEVPVGALVATEHNGDWHIIGRGRNRILEFRDPTAHAEMLALREACAGTGSERLNRAHLICTLEPCVMCAGASILARVDTVWFLAPLERGIGLGEIVGALTREGGEATHARSLPMNHIPRMEQVDAWREDVAELMRRFFRERRSRAE